MTMKLLTYAEGWEEPEVFSEMAACVPCERKEPAGHGFLRACLRQLGLEPYKDDGAGDSRRGGASSGASSSSEAGEDDGADDSGVDVEGLKAKAQFKGKGKKKEKKKDEDFYALLGLGAERWIASEKQIRDAYRKAALTMHPDKAAQNGLTHDEADARFKVLQDAYNTLSDPKKRREYDSTLEFDDFLPSSAESDQDFYRVFGAAFARQARWSERKPVPKLGDDSTPYDYVLRFYEFWFKFKSWRVFPHPDEEDEESAEGRDHRRWIRRNNEKLRAKEKKKEGARLREFVDNAYSCDPRVQARVAAEKEKREARKKEKAEERARREAEEKAAAAAAAKAAEEEEERRRAEEEARRRAEQVEKKALRKERARLSKLLASGAGGADIEGADVDALCQDLGLAEMSELCRAVEEGGDAAPRAVQDALGSVRAKRAAAEEARQRELAEMEARKEREAAEAEAAKARAMTEWSAEELRLLDKAVNEKFPPGSQRRWENIAAYVRTRTVDEVLVMVKQRLSKGHVPQAMRHDKYEIPEKRTGNLVITSEASVRDRAFTDVAVAGGGKAAAEGKAAAGGAAGGAVGRDLKGDASVATPKSAAKVVSAASGAWTDVQEKALVKAMKAFGKDVPDRWARVAEAVPGKSEAECKLRFKELTAAFKAKKEAAKAGK
ncbi:unnamed protein product [Pedinophyceae sp. YPF-701]|nr:unnamed protein product [Pedinophyceae sp. YPF-701]